MSRTLRLTAALLVVATAGFGAGDPGLSGGSAGSTAVIVSLFQFRPDTVTVVAGTRVVWTNQDDIEHTVTPGTPGTRDLRVAGGRLAGRGATHSAAFDKPGMYPYFCDRHAFMRGAVRVTPQGDSK